MITFLVFGLAISLYLIFFSYIEPCIIIGTINANTTKFAQELLNRNFEIIHADQTRDTGYDYHQSGKLAFKRFLKKVFKRKKVALFTSNPIFLNKLWKILFKYFFRIKIVDLRVTRSSNIGWAQNLSVQQALKYIPKYFEQGAVFLDETGQAKKRVDVLIEELERYEDERFWS